MTHRAKLSVTINIIRYFNFLKMLFFSLAIILTHQGLQQAAGQPSRRLLCEYLWPPCLPWHWRIVWHEGHWPTPILNLLSFRPRLMSSEICGCSPPEFFVELREEGLYGGSNLFLSNFLATMSHLGFATFGRPWESSPGAQWSGVLPLDHHHHLLSKFVLALKQAWIPLNLKIARFGLLTANGILYLST